MKSLNKRKAFIRGIISAFDLFGVHHIENPYKFKSDGEAIRDDWKRVGNYMRKAMSMKEIK